MSCKCNGCATMKHNCQCEVCKRMAKPYVCRVDAHGWHSCNCTACLTAKRMDENCRQIIVCGATNHDEEIRKENA